VDLTTHRDRIEKESSYPAALQACGPRAPGSGGSTLLLVGCASAALLVYCITLAPTVTSEDSGELIAAAYHFGVPHPSGYPLWTMLCGVFVRAVPVGSVAWRANLFSAACGSLAVGILAVALQTAGLARLAALSAVLCVAFGAVFWSQSVITEVYTLHALLFSILLWLLVSWLKHRDARAIPAAAFVAGLGMSNHHLFALSTLGVMATMLLSDRRQLLRPRTVLIAIVSFLLGLLPYVYLAISASRSPAMNWGNPSTYAAFWEHVGRGQYSAPGASGPSGWDVWAAKLRHESTTILGYVMTEQTWVTCCVGGLGLLGLVFFRRYRGLLLLPVLMLSLCHVVAFSFVHGIGHTRTGLWSSQVFFLTQYLLLAVPIAVSIDLLLRFLQRALARFDLRRVVLPVGAFSVLALPVVPLVQHWSTNNMSKYWYAYDHAWNILRSMEDDAIVFPSGDHNTFPLVYLSLVEGARPDVTIADMYGYIQPVLYMEMPGYAGRLPRSPGEREAIEMWIVDSTTRPVYHTVHPSVTKASWRVQPEGIVYRLLRSSEESVSDRFGDCIRYRNLEPGKAAPRDFGADNILADYAFFQGVHELNQGAPESALSHFEEATRYGVGIREVQNNVGSALAEYGYLEASLEFFRRAAAFDGDYATPRWNEGRILKKLDRIDEAYDAFKELARITPNDFRVHGELGFLALARGLSREQARAHWEASLALNPRQSQIIAALAEHLLAGPHQATLASTITADKPADRSGRTDAELPLPPQARPQAKQTDASRGQASVEPPALLIQQTRYSVGTVAPRSLVEYAFTFENTTRHPVRILRVAGPAGNIRIEPADLQRPPGAFGVISGAFVAPETPGPFMEMIRVATNEDNATDILLQVSGDVQPVHRSAEEAPP
jgi:hypothetical protein